MPFSLFCWSCVMKLHKLCFAVIAFFSFVAIAESQSFQLPESVKISFNGNAPAGHIQGVATDGKFIYISYSVNILKCDFQGNVIKGIVTPRFDGFEDPKNDLDELKNKYNVRTHHSGDCCFHDGKLYVTYSGSGFNKYLKGGYSYNYVYVFDSDLNFLTRYHVPEMEHGAGGMTFANGKFYLVGGRPFGVPGNTVYEYDSNFKLLKKHQLKINSDKGIQTISWDGKYFWLGCYGIGEFSFLYDENFNTPFLIKGISAVGVIHSSDGSAALLFKDVMKNRRIASTVAKRINVKEQLGKIYDFKIEGKDKFTFEGNPAEMNNVYAFLRYKDKNRIYIFIRYTKEASQESVARAVLLAQQLNIKFQLLAE